MSFLLVEFVVQVGCARMDHAVHSMFARVGMSAPMEGAEQDLIGFGLAESVAQATFARSGRNASKTDASFLLFLPAESAALKMFVRVGMSAPMEGVHLADHAVLVTVEYAR